MMGDDLTLAIVGAIVIAVFVILDIWSIHKDKK